MPRSLQMLSICWLEFCAEQREVNINSDQKLSKTAHGSRSLVNVQSEQKLSKPAPNSRSLVNVRSEQKLSKIAPDGDGKYLSTTHRLLAQGWHCKWVGSPQEGRTCLKYSAMHDSDVNLPHALPACTSSYFWPWSIFMGTCHTGTTAQDLVAHQMSRGERVDY